MNDDEKHEHCFKHELVYNLCKLSLFKKPVINHFCEFCNNLKMCQEIKYHHCLTCGYTTGSNFTGGLHRDGSFKFSRYDTCSGNLIDLHIKIPLKLFLETTNPSGLISYLKQGIGLIGFDNEHLFEQIEKFVKHGISIKSACQVTLTNNIILEFTKIDNTDNLTSPLF
jgi:hypothetical protein